MTPIQKKGLLLTLVGLIAVLQILSQASRSSQNTRSMVNQSTTENSSNIISLVNTGEAITHKTFVQNIYQQASAGFYLELPTEEGKKPNFIDTPMESSEFDITISGNIVRTRVTQTFRNTSDIWQHGVYVFPLAQDAAVDAMLMVIGERKIEGVIKQKEVAEKDFAEAKKAGRSASIVNQIRPNMFVNKVANIAPDSSIVVTIEYQQVLGKQDEYYELRVPSAITPRYIPQSASIPNTTAPNVNAQGAPIENSDQRIRTLQNAFTAPADLDIQVNINMGTALSNIHSEHHQISQSHDSEHIYQVKLEREQALPEEFVLRWQLAQTDAPTALHLTQNINGYQYGLIQLTPPKQNKQALPRELTFILDTSGSMVGGAIEQAKQALITGVQSLDSKDTFNIIEFNSRAQNLWQSAQIADVQNKSEALAFISQLQASGGTEIADALNLAFSLRRANEQESKVNQRLEQILFITDGSVSNEAQLLQIISRHLGSTRLFTVGIGSAPNTYFMTEAAIAGKGSFTFIGDITQVEAKMTALLTKIQRPALTKIQLTHQGRDLTNKFEVYPSVVPDLYAGEPLTLLYRRVFDDTQLHALNIEATWYENKKQAHTNPMMWRSPLPEKKLKANAGIAKQWAYTKIRQLTRSFHTSSAQGEEYLALQHFTEASISKTALDHQLVSQYTSLIAIDEQLSRPTQAFLAKLAEQSPQQNLRNQQWLAASASLPQTGTGSWLLIFCGLGLVTGAGIIRLFIFLKAVA